MPDDLKTKQDLKGLPWPNLLLFVFDRFYHLASRSIPWAGIAICLYIGVYMPIRDSAGQDTKISHIVNVVTDFGLDKAAYLVLALSGVGYGALQRKLRKDAIEHLHGRSKEGELVKDPGRTSSELTERGDTPKEP